jgi:hypothetical protein
MKLPKRPNTHKLEDESRLFFESLVKSDLFLCREGDRKDYGVDLRLELMLDKSLTSNVHIHVQLKGHEDFEYSKGRVKQEIEVSTLEYLLQQPMSIVACYSRAQKSIRYVVLSEQYLASVNPEWREQKSLTIYPEVEFTPDAQKSLHASAWKRHQMLKSVNDQLDSSISPDQVSNMIVLKDKIVPESELVNDLKRFGHALVSRGDLPLVRELLGRVSNKTLNTDLDILKLQAHLHFNESDLGAAEHTAAQFRRIAEINGLQEDEFIHWLVLSIHRIQDVLTEDEKRELSEARPPRITPEYVLLKSDMIKSRSLAREIGLDVIRQEYETLKEWCNHLDGETREMVEIQVDADRISIEMLFFNDDFIRAVGQRATRKTLGVELPESERLRRAKQMIERGAKLMLDYLDVLDRAEKCHSRVLYVDVVYSYVTSQVEYYTVTLSLAENFPDMGIKSADVGNRLERMIPRLDFCFAYWNHIGDFYRSTKVIGMKHAVYVLLKNDVMAAAASDEFVERVRRFGLKDMERDIEQDDQGHRRLHTVSLPTVSHDDETTDYRGIAPERLARHMMDSFHLPEERYGNVLLEAQAINNTEHMQFEHCRHLELNVPLSGQNDPATMYSRKPDFKFRCKKLGYQTKLASEDYETVARAFVGAYCSECDQREPKTVRSN